MRAKNFYLQGESLEVQKKTPVYEKKKKIDNR